MSAVIFATGNRHKLAEMAELLPGVELGRCRRARDAAGERRDFEANALIKARAARAATGAAVVADDSGIEAEDLGGRPASTRPATPASMSATRTTSPSCCAKSTPPAATAAPPMSASWR